jgi:hypothetical protein
MDDIRERVVEKIKAVFMFDAPEADSKKHKTTISTQAMELHVVGVKNYDEACKVAKELVNQGIAAIELCGGFGNVGVAKVSEAVEYKLPIGVVRFDIHPGLDSKSGDKVFI